MKKILGKITAALSLSALLISVVTSCASLPELSEEQIAKFQNSEGSPNDCVVFYGFLPMNDVVKFKQIDKNFPADEQDGIALKITDSSGFWLSTPVKPGSTYMISYMKGHVQGGFSTDISTIENTATSTTYKNTTTFNTYVWDQNFTEDMQYFVIKIPEEPGLYCFGMYTGREIMYNAQNGKATQIFDQNNLTEKWGKNYNQLIVSGLQQVSKAYKGTEWEEACLKDIEKFSKK